MRPPSYGCTREVVKNERSVAQPLPKCIHKTREARSPWTNWFVSTNWNLTGMHFIGFIASSACVRQIMEHADEVSKLLGGNCVTLLKMLSTENLSKQRFKPWSNGLASSRKLTSWVYLRLRLARPCVHLRWLVMTCDHFGRDQICRQVNASFLPFGHPTQVS